MFAQLISKAKYKLLLIVAFAFTLTFVFFKTTSSLWFSISFGVVICYVIYFFLVMKAKRNCMSDVRFLLELSSAVDDQKGKKLVAESELNGTGIKGICKVSNKLYVIYLKADSEGIKYSFLPLINDSIYLLNWSTISKVFIGEIENKNGKQMSIEVLLHESDAIVIFPWDESMTSIIPSFIGVEDC